MLTTYTTLFFGIINARLRIQTMPLPFLRTMPCFCLYINTCICWFSTISFVMTAIIICPRNSGIRICVDVKQTPCRSLDKGVVINYLQLIATRPTHCYEPRSLHTHILSLTNVVSNTISAILTTVFVIMRNNYMSAF